MSAARFGALTVVVALLLSLAVLPWIDLSWWKIFRRCVSIGAGFSLWYCVWRTERSDFRSYGLDLSAKGRRQIAFGLLLGIAALALLFALWLSTGHYEYRLTPDRSKLWRTMLGFLPAALLVGCIEELVFRGYLLQQLQRCSRFFAVVASSAMYSAVHLRHSSIDAVTVRELTGLFILGAVLAVAYFRTGSLAVSIGIHAALAYGARVNKLVIAIPETPLSWLVGTSRLINGIASWVALLALAGILVMFLRQPRKQEVAV